jgi:two-component system NtrC family sensor kinase
LAVLLGLVAMGARAAMQPLLGDRLPFVCAFPAVVLVALRQGALHGLATTLVCVAWALFPGLAPHVPEAARPVELGSFMIAALFTLFFCAHYRERPERQLASPEISETALTRWLRAVVWGAALIPLTAFAAACWWGYEKAFEDAHLTARRANTVVSEHAQRALDTARGVATRVQEVTQLPDAELRARQAELHTRLNDIAIGIPSIYTITVIDAAGRALVSSRAFPVDTRVELSDRDYFKHVRDTPGVQFYVSELVTGRLTGLWSFNTVVPRQLSGAGFSGVIVVTMKPSYFQDFYRTLTTEQPGLNSFSFFKTDGALLTRWPAPSEGTTRVPETSPILAQARAGHKSGALYVKSSFDTEHRLISFQRLRDLPIYTTAGLSQSAILSNWYRFVEPLGAIVVPTTAVLVYVSWIALQRTRRAQAVAQELESELRRRIQAEQALIQSQKLEALGQLTGGVAHDFNNLLAIISNNVHLLQRLDPGGKGSNQVAAIARATASGVKLTRQLLSFARRHAAKPELITLQDWLPGVADLLRTTLGSRIQFVTAVEADTAPIEADPAELELALLNLVVNAKDAMPAGGTIRLSASNGAGERGRQVVVRVSDTGAGIAPEVLPRVFEPFFTTKAPGAGSGLGLSQVYGLCQQAGGTVSVDSTPGQGTTVSLCFEARAPRGPTQAPLALPQAAPLSGWLLLVEDNDELAQAMVALLKSTGLQVDRARNADMAAAMAEMQDSPYDVVLSDIVMPGQMNGVQLAFRLRNTRPGLPIILTTGYASMASEAATAGFVVLDKPTPPDELFAELRRALGKKAAGAR